MKESKWLRTNQSKANQGKAFDCLNGWMNWSDWVHLNFKNFNSNLNLLTWKKRKLNESVEMTMAQTHITSQWKCSVLSIQNKKEEKRIKVIEKWENRLNHILKFQATFFLTLTLSSKLVLLDCYKNLSETFKQHFNVSMPKNALELTCQLHYCL